MVENAKKMGCGGCGNETFEIYQEDKGLIAECCKCKSISSIRVTIPKIHEVFCKTLRG